MKRKSQKMWRRFHHRCGGTLMFLSCSGLRLSHSLGLAVVSIRFASSPVRLSIADIWVQPKICSSVLPAIPSIYQRLPLVYHSLVCAIPSRRYCNRDRCRPISGASQVHRRKIYHIHWLGVHVYCDNITCTCESKRALLELCIPSRNHVRCLSSLLICSTILLNTSALR